MKPPQHPFTMRAHGRVTERCVGKAVSLPPRRGPVAPGCGAQRVDKRLRSLRDRDQVRVAAETATARRKASGLRVVTERQACEGETAGVGKGAMAAAQPRTGERTARVSRSRQSRSSNFTHDNPYPPLNQPTTNQPASQPTNQPTSQPTNQPPTTQPTNQPTRTRRSTMRRVSQ